MILEFLNELTQAGYRIFTVSDAAATAETLAIKKSNIPYILKSLVNKKLIRQLYRGTYAIEDNILSGSPLHKFEIAMHLSRHGSVCCWAAFIFHELSDQVLSKVFVFSFAEKGKKRSDYQYRIDGYDFRLIQLDPQDKWGIEKRYMGEVRVNITDLERTLLDGLTYPHYCGGIREVISAFSIAQNRINVRKIIEYSLKMPVSVQKRLGWILTQLSLGGLDELKHRTHTTYYDKLDPLGKRRGKYNKEWMLVENF